MAAGLDGRFKRIAVASSDASVYVSSTDDFEFCCNSCTTRGGHVEAVGYCVECTEYLCISCIKYHLQNKILKGHVLLNLKYRITNVSDITKDNQNQSQQQTTTDNYSDSIDDIDNLTLLKSLNVKTRSDEKDCRIVDIVVLSGQLLAVADSGNMCVKLINSNDDVVKDTVKLTNQPNSMTRLPQDQLAVTLAEDQLINILSIKNGLKIIKKIRVDGLCLGIVYFNAKLLVSFRDPLMFQVLNMEGKVLEKIVPEQDVTSSCTIPRYIALSPDEKTIYISDWKSKICLSVDMKGKKIAECTELSFSGGIVCSPNLPYIIVCEDEKHVVRKLTMDLQCDEILLNNSDGLEFPLALCFCPDQRYVIVGSNSKEAEHRNKIRIYQY